MMQQLTIFDVIRRPAVIVAVDPDGPVIKGEVDAVYRLPHPRLAWDYATIEIHQHDNGLHMWSASFHADQGGKSYRVGPKWGNFAETREDAIYYAACEILARAHGEGRETAAVRNWATAIRDNPEGAKPN